MKTNLFRPLAWAVLLAAIYFTLSPIGLRPRSFLPLSLERAMAFLIVALLLSLAYPRRFRLILAAMLVGIAGLELLQYFLPGRHGLPRDAVIKGFGAIAGIGLGWLANRWRERRHPPAGC